MITSRIKELRDYLGLTQQGFADKMSVSRGYLGDIERGRVSPSFNFIKSLIEVYNVNLLWIMNGEGPMYPLPVDELPKEMSSKVIKEISKILEQLNDEQRQEILLRTQEMLKVNMMEKEMREVRKALERIEQLRKQE